MPPRAKPKPNLDHIVEGLRDKAMPMEGMNLDPANARIHDERNLAAIKASLAAFGQDQPLVIQSEGMIVRKGNGRLTAARQLGWTHIAAIVIDEETAKGMARGIADNRSGELATWDEPVLAEILRQIPDLEQVGFTQGDLDRLIRSTAGTDTTQDVPPPVPDDPITKLGDVWTLGRHRLVCGDALKVNPLQVPHATMAFTDPPYNVAYGKLSGPKHRERAIANDDMPPEAWAEFCAAIAGILKERVDGCIYVCHAARREGRVMATALDAAMHCGSTIIWKKDRLVLGRSKYHSIYEPIWFGWSTSGRQFSEDRTLTDVWEIDRPSKSPEHPTMKPVELVARAITHATGPGGTVYDPFLGSGTTLIAAEQLDRTCYGTELDPGYCDVIVERWQNLTGGKAERDGQ